MYRQYEDPRKLEKELAKELARINKPGYEPDDYDWERIEELKDRINFAWQDDEYESDCRINEGYC